MRNSAFAASVLFSLFLASASHATTRTWGQTAGGSNGSWTNSSLWQPAGLPQASDDLLITLAGSYSCGTGANFTIRSLTMGGSSGSKTVTVSPSTGLAVTSGVTINSNSTLSVRGAVTDGTIDVNNGATLVAESGSMITGQDSITLKGGLMVNRGSEFRGRSLVVTDTGLLEQRGPLVLGDGATIVNRGVVFVYGGNISRGGGAGGSITNERTLSLRDGGSLSIGVDVTNQGTFEIGEGSVAFNSATYKQTAGRTSLGGGSLSGPIDLSGGSVTGTGTVSGDVSNGGTLSLASPVDVGQISINGTYTQQPTGQLQIKIGGPALFDKLAISGLASLGGQISLSFINGFVPVAGMQFPVITFGAWNNSFFAIQNGFQVGDIIMKPVYSPSGVTLVAQLASLTCGTDSLCMIGDRFDVALSARDPRTGKTGAGVPTQQNDVFGYFTIPSLTGNTANPEVIFKMLDGRAVNGRFWVFYGGLTDFEYTLTITDRTSGATRTYTKPGGTFDGNADTSAFAKLAGGVPGTWVAIDAPPDTDTALPPVSTSEAACVSTADSLCVLNGRFRIRLSAVDPRTSKSGAGVALPQNDLYGYFSIPALTGNPGNVEVAVKMLDGRSVNGKFWIFYGGLTDFAYTLTVTDVDRSVTKNYTKPGGTFSGNADTSAF